MESVIEWKECNNEVIKSKSLCYKLLKTYKIILCARIKPIVLTENVLTYSVH